jgi:large subunit ribosomal protein L29
MVKIKELKEKSIDELRKILLQEREKIQKINFDLKLKKNKNVRELRKTKKTIAQILTLLKILSEAQPDSQVGRAKK